MKNTIIHLKIFMYNIINVYKSIFFIVVSISMNNMINASNNLNRQIITR